MSVCVEWQTLGVYSAGGYIGDIDLCVYTVFFKPIFLLNSEKYLRYRYAWYYTYVMYIHLIYTDVIY